MLVLVVGDPSEGIKASLIENKWYVYADSMINGSIRKTYLNLN